MEFVSKNRIATFICPKCKKGNILKGNTAYGCSNHKSGCNFRVPFETVKKLLKNDISKDAVYEILKNYDKIV